MRLRARTSTAALLLLTILLALNCTAIEPQPDILLVMPDQMRGDCLSILGHPSVRTPNLDALARQGALFRRAYSTCPSCIPARASLLTGLFPRTSGVVGYQARPIVAPTLPKLLREAGYTTILVGRYMHQIPAAESYGFQKEIRGSVYVDNDDYDQFLRKAAPETGGIRALVNRLGLSFNGWEAKPWPLAEELHPTAWIVRQARQALGDDPGEKPMFLTASFYTPHPPLYPPIKYFASCAASQLPQPAHGDWVNWKALTAAGNKTGDRVLLQDETLRATESGYFGLINHLDEQLGPLLADFKERSRKAKRPWVILLTSDHGEMLGDHGYFRKCEPFEGSANIPFIVAGAPELGFQGGLRPMLPVCLEDVMPTLLDLAGAKCPAVDGVSLKPTLRAEKQDIRPWLQFEHAPCYNKEQGFQALTDGHVKYIWRPLDGTQYLFDLDQDPREEHDLSSVPSRTILLSQCRERMIRLLNGRPEGFSDGTNLITGRPYPALQERGHTPPGKH